MKTFFLIKPDGMLHEQRALAMIKERFEIDNYETLTATDEFICRIYKSAVPYNILPAVKAYLRERPIGCGFARTSIDSFIELTGRNMIPLECPSGTIRREYGAGIGKTASGLIIIRNAIHRPKDMKQNIEFIQVLRDCYGINPYQV